MVGEFPSGNTAHTDPAALTRIHALADASVRSGRERTPARPAADGPGT